MFKSLMKKPKPDKNASSSSSAFTSSTHSSPYSSSRSSSSTSSTARMIVIGETGSGKSTFINYLTNFFLKGSLKHLRVAIPTRFRKSTEKYTHDEKDVSDVTVSKTDSCHEYKFIRNGRSYLFLDTPGLSDTRGVDQDDKNLENIVSSVENLDDIVCVIIVINGTAPRLSASIKNVIVRMQGFLPDAILDHVIVVLSNVYFHICNFDINALDLNGTVHPFYMQNSAFSTDPSRWDDNAMKLLQHDWDIAFDELERMIGLIDTFQVKSVQAFTEMKNIRHAIKSLMHEARLEVENIQKMQDKMAALEKALKAFGDDQEKYKDYTRQNVMTVEKLADAGYHSTICSSCSYVCHENCGLQETFTKGDETLSGCAAMNNGRCTVCSGKCPFEEHYHDRKTMQTVTQTMDEVLHDIKAMYDAASQNRDASENELNTVQGAKQMLDNALQQKKDDIKRNCIELKRICTGFNIVDELWSMIKQLQLSKQSIKNIDARQQAEDFINSLIGLCDSFENDKDVGGSNLKKSNMKIDQGYKSSARLQMINREEEQEQEEEEEDDRARQRLSKQRASKPSPLKRPVVKQRQRESEYEEEDDNNDDAEKSDVNDIIARIKNGGRSPTNSSGASPKTSTQQRSITAAASVATEKRSLPVKVEVNELRGTSTANLVAQHNDCIQQNDINSISLIIQELNNRSRGKSIGPLGEDDQQIFTENIQQCAQMDRNLLREKYMDLQSKIEKAIDTNILLITQIPKDILLKNAAIYSLLQSQQRSDNTKGGRAENDYSARDRAFYRDRPVDHDRPFDRDRPVDHDRPVDRDRAFDRDRPSDRDRPADRDRTSEPRKRRDDYGQSNDDFSSLPLEHRSSPPPAQQWHNSIGVSSMTELDISNDNLKRSSRLKLNALYNEARKRNNFNQQKAIYDEYENRCFGKSRTNLIQDHNTEFQSKVQEYSNKSLEDLKTIYTNLKETIQKLMGNDDAAVAISKLPKETLIKIAAIAHLVEQKELEH